MLSKKILPIKDKPSITTCIHHAYQCAIIESQELAQVEIQNYSEYAWNAVTVGTTYTADSNIVAVYAEEDAETQDLVLWRDCDNTDEFIIFTKYIKHKDFGRCVDLFLFADDLEQEMASQDKSCGFRWNPYGYFVKKDMYFYDTKLFKYMKVCVKEGAIAGFASKDGVCWEEIASFPIDEAYSGKKLKIGVHAHLGENFFRIWKNMNFIQLLYNRENEWKGIFLDYFLFPRKNIDNGYGYYTAFLETQYETTYEIFDLFDSIHDYIHWNIQHYYYPELCLDELYVPERKYFGRHHYDHYNLFYGYDDEKQVYYVMGYGADNKPIVSEIPYSVFENKEVITSEKLIRFKYAANDVTNLRFNIQAVKTSLEEFLHSSDSGEKFANLLTQEPVLYGIEIFKYLATEKPSMRIYYDRRIAFCILEHSKFMQERLDYLLRHNYLQEEQYMELAKQSTAIVDKATMIMNAVIKGIIKKKDSPKVIDYLLELYDLEKSFLTDLLRALE